MPEPSCGAGQAETRECSLMPASDTRTGSSSLPGRSAPSRAGEYTSLEPQSSFSAGDEELVEISAEEFMGIWG